MDELGRLTRAAREWTESQDAHREAFKRFASALDAELENDFPVGAIAEAAGVARDREGNWFVSLRVD
jgi:hypothetical protein